MAQQRQNERRKWLFERRNHMEMQTLVYWYESAALTCIAAWGTTLGWSQTASLRQGWTAQSAARLALPIGLTAGAFYALLRTDYYKKSLDKHMAWIAFQGALGVCMANSVKLLFKA